MTESWTAADYPREHIACLVLAGGRARRMGGINKVLTVLNGRPLIEIAASNMLPQCAQLLVSANDANDFHTLPWPVIHDLDDTRSGPIAGILAAMEWCAVNRPEIGWLLSVPVDCPFLPSDLGSRLWNAATSTNEPLALAASGGRTHFVSGLWSVSLRDAIRQQLIGKGVRRAEAIAEACGYATAEWPASPRDPFFNINTPDDLRAAHLAENSRLNDRH